MSEETKYIPGPFTVDQVRELIPMHYNVDKDFINFSGDSFNYSIDICVIDSILVSMGSVNVNVGKSTFFFYKHFTLVSVVAL